MHNSASSQLAFLVPTLFLVSSKCPQEGRVLVSVFPNFLIFCFSAGDDDLWLALPCQSPKVTWKLGSPLLCLRGHRIFWGLGQQRQWSLHHSLITALHSPVHCIPILHFYIHLLYIDVTSGLKLWLSVSLCQKPGWRGASWFSLCSTTVLMPQNIS